VWQIDGLRTGFCVKLLVDPSKLDVRLPRDAQPLRADKDSELGPALRSVIAEQPEFAGWSPSKVCVYYAETVTAGPVRVSERKPDKAPMIGLWSIAAMDGAERKDLVLRLFTNSGRLERAAGLSGLDLREVRSSVEDVVNDEAPNAPPIGIRYQIRLGKATLTWEGRRASDSTRADGPVAAEWRADSRRHGPLDGRLTLTPEWTKPMVGWLQVEGKDAFAEAVKGSPTRFVGPAMQGGGGELAFGR
jgi:hypothetical protein